MKNIHYQSALLAEKQLHALPYLANDSSLWTDAKKQLTVAITELQKPFFREKKESISNARIETFIGADEIKVQMNKSGLLGRGGYGTVRAGFIEYYGFVAIKVSLFRGSSMEMETMEKKYLKEIELLHQANHENILRILGYSSYKDSLAIIMEYMPGGSLQALLFCKDEGNDFLVPDISNILRLRFCSDISQGVSYLHSAFFDQRVVHGDLKPSNVLLTCDLKCKVGDFGGADIATCTEALQSPKDRLSMNGECTPGFIAPERMNNPQLRVSKAMDVYSIGMIFYGIMRRVHPTRDMDQNKKEITQFCLPTNGSQCQDPVESTLKQMMLKCTDHDPQQRPRASELRDKLHSLLCKQDPVKVAQSVADVLKTYKCRHFIDHSLEFIALPEVEHF